MDMTEATILLVGLNVKLTVELRGPNQLFSKTISTFLTIEYKALLFL
jgi:hypothetical protein